MHIFKLPEKRKLKVKFIHYSTQKVFGGILSLCEVIKKISKVDK